MMSNFKFDLQFFGGSKTTHEQVRKRDPLPEGLTNLRDTLYNKVMPGLESFDGNSWNRAQNISDNAMGQMNGLVNMIPNGINQSNKFLKGLSDTLTTGEIPSGVTDKLNAGVEKSLQSSMGSMLNGLANRGVVNSSVTSQGVNNLSQAAADAYNRNYLNAYNSILSGYGSGLQGALGVNNSLLNSINTLGKIPSMAYEGAAAPLMPGYNFFKDWYQLRNSEPEEYDTIVQQKSSGCITGDTLVTLADGQEIPVSELQDNDEIKTWDFDKGCLTSASLTAFFKRNFDKPLDVIRVVFDDGSTVGVIFEHLFFDLTLNKFIAINADSQDFIGHYFAKVNQDGNITPVKVNAVFTDEKTTQTYAPQCLGYQNFLAAGFITGNDGQLEICNRFDFDSEHVCYEPKKKSEDLNKHERLQYEDFQDFMSNEFFYNNHIDEWGIACSKGLISAEKVKAYLAHFSHCFLNN
ncbi:MAG: hypothetical protein II917_10170 [Synergistaceae bacterium]|nr:hypothetical protein [Synergistaceae bacterium]